MEACVIVTYRCNARCQMCHTWKHPSRREEEISPEVMDKLPGGHERLNITGGEPLLRADIEEIVAVLDKKTKRLEISTNGYFTEKIISIAEKYPRITIRVSVEGLPKRNDELRGIPNGFDHALRTILRLKEMGIKDIGFAIVISDRNVSDLVDLYHLCEGLGVDFAGSAMHNSFYFHKSDNKVEELEVTLRGVRDYIQILLQSGRRELRMRVKDWFRSYLNMGLLRYLEGKRRPLACGAGRDSFFVDPWGEVLACNGSSEPWRMGNLQETAFEEIWHSSEAEDVRKQAKNCARNCWMTGTAVPAMRKQLWVPALWVLKNKLRMAIGKGPVFYDEDCIPRN
ncbi:MAG: radical SAM protein [Thermodesulfobacteriota bacterium]